MTTLFLIRHGTNDLVGKAIAGWAPGVHLNAEGRSQAERLVDRLKRAQIRQIYSSPLERAQETAQPLSRAVGLEIQTARELGEIHFGPWTGKRFTDLSADPKWQQWNAARSLGRVPGGESMLEVQSRVVGFIQKLAEEYPGDVLALFSHGDPIRSALLYYLGMPLDAFNRMEVSPASVSVVQLGDTGARVMCLNQTLE